MEGLLVASVVGARGQGARLAVSPLSRGRDPVEASRRDRLRGNAVPRDQNAISSACSRPLCPGAGRRGVLCFPPALLTRQVEKRTAVALVGSEADRAAGLLRLMLAVESPLRTVPEHVDLHAIASRFFAFSRRRRSPVSRA